MRPALRKALRADLRSDSEFAEAYVESHLNTTLAAQIKVLREQNGWTKAELARNAGVSASAISRTENVNHAAWNVKTLNKLARAFRLRLKVSFETYGSLLKDIDKMNWEDLRRVPREADKDLSVD